MPLSGPRPKWRALLRLLLASATVALAACASVPDVDEAIEAWADAEAKLAAHGPLTTEQSREVLGRLDTEPGEAGLLSRHLAIEQAVTESPLIPGNRTRLLRDGAATFAAMFQAMEAAKHEIDLEYFILEDVESDGRRLGDLLVAKCREGVAVNIIYDSYGSKGTPPEFFERLEAAGAQLLEFRPLNPLLGENGYAPNHRDHRKLLVVDNATAIVGGINLSTTYETSGSGLSKPSADDSPDHWRDTDLVIEGPAAGELRALFLQHWAQEKGEPLALVKALPDPRPKGEEVVRVVDSSPDDPLPAYYVTLLSAIRNAEQSVWLTTGYFVPTPQAKEDLMAAARRGVDVRLLLPGESDSNLALAVAHTHYEDLLEAGVKIYELHGQILHAKTATIDGVWSSVGSSNFDYRSVIFNDEVDVVVLGRKTAQELRQMFENDMRRAKPIDLSAWGDRPFLPRVKGFFVRFSEVML